MDLLDLNRSVKQEISLGDLLDFDEVSKHLENLSRIFVLTFGILDLDGKPLAPNRILPVYLATVRTQKMFRPAASSFTNALTGFTKWSLPSLLTEYTWATFLRVSFRSTAILLT
jgi:hypothetical protein